MPLRHAVHDTRLITALLTVAEREARALGDPHPAAEHLLLAALLCDDPSARDALGIEADTFRAAIGAVHSASLSTVGVIAPDLDVALPPARGAYRSDPSTRDVFQRARSLSRSSTTGLRSAHVLLAAAESERGTVARVIDRLGLDRATVLDDAAAAIPS